MSNSAPDWLLKKVEEARAEGRILSDSHASLPEQGGKFTTPDTRPIVRKRSSVELIESAWVRRNVWVVGLETRNETNLRQWKARSNRAGVAWKAVRETIHLGELVLFEHAKNREQKVYARFTRLAPRTLDKFANLPASLKAVEDVVCFLIGLDDASPLWNPVCDQEVNDAMGVRIELSLEPF